MKCLKNNSLFDPGLHPKMPFWRKQEYLVLYFGWLGASLIIDCFVQLILIFLIPVFFIFFKRISL
jgi:hypothetical protein